MVILAMTQDGNGRTYVSTKWALGIVLSILVLAISAWGKWVQATVTNNHDALIRNSSKLESIDRNVLNNAELLKIILKEHRTLPGIGNLE